MKQRSHIGRIVSRLGWRSLETVGCTRKRVAQLLGRTRLNHREMELLETMRDANKCSCSPFRSSDIWTHLGKRFDDLFWWEGIGDVEASTINNYFSSPHPGDRKLLRYACWMYYQLLKDRDKHRLLSKIPATVNPASGLSFQFDGQLVSWDQLISIDTLYSIAEASPSVLSEPVVVLDLGAGWGRMGYVLKKANPLCTYVICDLPEALLVSSTYLPRLLPSEKVHAFCETRTGHIDERLLRGGGLVFLGTQDITRLPDKAIDVFINVASFQEMTPVQVNEYFEVIDKKVKGVFFCQQLRSAQTHSFQLGEIAALEQYPFRSAWERRYLRNSTFSDLYFETAQIIS